MKDNSLKILDCTLRDGSYSLNFQFTAEDSALIAAGLEQAGIPLIEIGHGLGMNASHSGYTHAAAEDEEYLETVASVLKKSDFGMFFIPGIGRINDLKIAAKYGMDFVRVGTNIDEAEKSEKYVSYAKDLGLKVSVNLMKSYALGFDGFLRKSRMVSKYGADIICVVDSAGGMLESEVRKYIRALREHCPCEIGFHSHANFQLAVSNSVAAIESGATVIDTSLQGIGRSAGNAQTEVLVMLLGRMGIDLGIDKYKLLELGEKVIKPLMREKFGVDSISATCGYALFHSSFLPLIESVAKEYNIDSKRLIVEISKVEKIHVTEELARKVAFKIKHEASPGNINRVGQVKFGFMEKRTEKKKLAGQVKELLKEIYVLSQKTGKSTALTIAKPFDVKQKTVNFPFIRQNSHMIIGNIEVSALNQAKKIAKMIDGYADYVFIDRNNLKPVDFNLEDSLKAIVKKSTLLTYRDATALINAIDSLIFQLEIKRKLNKILLLGLNPLTTRLALNLSDRGVFVCLWDADQVALKETVAALNKLVNTSDKFYMEAITDPVSTASSVQAIVCLLPGKPTISKDLIRRVNRNSIIIDAGIGTICPEAIELANRRNLLVYRIDMRAGLSGEITSVLETHKLLTETVGRDCFNGVSVVAGGLIGKKGDIVVDSIANPEMILGIADGRGGFIRKGCSKAYQIKLRKVKYEIIKRKYP